MQGDRRRTKVKWWAPPLFVLFFGFMFFFFDCTKIVTSRNGTEFPSVISYSSNKWCWTTQMESHTTRGSDRQQILARCRFCVRCGVDAGQWKTGETWSNGSACYVFPFSFFFKKIRKKGNSLLAPFSHSFALLFPPLSLSVSFYPSAIVQQTRLDYIETRHSNTRTETRVCTSRLFFFSLFL